jgi:uncharacterized protein (DUF1800 family)
VGLPAAALASATLLSACGGGGGSTGGSGSTAPVINAPPVTEIQASRFLAQASTGATREQIARVSAIGYAAWIDEQMAMSPSQTRWDWLVAKGFNAAANIFTQNGFDSVVWYKLINAPDTLRQRVTFALSEIIVVGIDGLVGAGWQAFSAAQFLDLLEAQCFGNFRTLLENVSTSAAMGQYLTYRGNTKYNAKTGALPDENYARELMQLFSIGLLKLNPDGTPLTVNGVQQETYTLDDITGLARVFTGWDFDLSTSKTDTPDFLRRPMTQVDSRHETGASTFLGATVPAGLNGAQSLKAALDIIFAHPNVAPFICRQLIQRLVTSNPTPAYVQRVASVFLNDGKGVKGNLGAVVKACCWMMKRATQRISVIRNPVNCANRCCVCWHGRVRISYRPSVVTGVSVIPAIRRPASGKVLRALHRSLIFSVPVICRRIARSVPHLWSRRNFRSPMNQPWSAM